jgi:hypothetical protein
MLSRRKAYDTVHTYATSWNLTLADKCIFFNFQGLCYFTDDPRELYRYMKYPYAIKIPELHAEALTPFHFNIKEIQLVEKIK